MEFFINPNVYKALQGWYINWIKEMSFKGPVMNFK